jgi:hypothetical protein
MTGPSHEPVKWRDAGDAIRFLVIKAAKFIVVPAMAASMVLR